MSIPTAATSLPPSQPDSEDEDDAIYTSWQGGKKTGSLTNVRSRPSLRRPSHDKLICTKPGEGAGETETEADEPPRHLPTARKVRSSGPLIPPNFLQQFVTPLFFEFSRLLSIVPALFGTLYNIYHILNPPAPSNLFPDGRHPPERIDFFVSALWAILTGYQCLCLTIGLLTRWRLYYPPLATLIRLLALQAICWPATHFTLILLEHERRPVITWAVIGTTTSVSRSIQLWVTSNLWWDASSGASEGGVQQRWRGGKWGGRRWDWREVGLKCVLPAGIVYCVMAWADQIRREWAGC